MSPTLPQDDIDLFAGPGGWDEGVRPLGVRPLGIEWDEEACATGRAAGHRRLKADVSALDPCTVVAEELTIARLRGLIASPPCQGFSAAGKGRGREDAELLLAAIPHMVDRDVRPELRDRMADSRSVFALEPLRWALATEPEWCTWEQVPAVLPIWQACAHVLRDLGYSVAVGVLHTEQFGVPQTRRRAILVARNARMTAQLGPAALPEPTHSRYYERTPSKLDPGVPRWVSMADALGWSRGDLAGFPRRADTEDRILLDGVAYRARDLHSADRPAPALTEKARSWRRWTRESVGAVAPSSQGQHRVELHEASQLQTFPADYPWQGTRTVQFRQIGDAVPPLLGRQVVAAASGLARVADTAAVA